MLTSKIYKFKIAELDISVTIDESFTVIPDEFDSSILSAEEIHCHALHELFFVGNNPLIILNENSPLEYKNCLVCIPPLFNHNSIRSDDYRILFSYKKSKNKTAFSDFMDSMFSSDIPFSAKTDSSLNVYISELATLIHNSGIISSEIITSLLKLIFYDIYKCNGEIKEKNVSNTRDSHLIIIDHVLNNYQKDINLQIVADALNLSTKQASRIIRKNYKATLSELATARRLSVACALLLTTDMSVSDIIEHINFPSESYFYSQFKQKYGCTPLKFRKSKLNKSFDTSD